MTPLRTTFTQYADLFSEILDGAREAWDRPTPCTGWRVRDIVDHVIDTQRDFLSAQGLKIQTSTEGGPRERWERHREAVDKTFADDGLWSIEYDGHFGRTTIGATLTDFYGWDLVVHAWDIARATHQQWQPDDAMVAVLNQTADGWGPVLHMEGVCAAPITIDPRASLQDKLLARLGRDPHWQPAPA